jgi:formylmethanofuran dehydrogenase subunit E
MERIMTANHVVFQDENFEKCVDFHGHACPGLAMGYRAGKAGMEWLGERRAADEEIVAVVETDACGCDAVQVITGCTFGKGNFIFKDYGKHAFSFLSRSSGRGVRLVSKSGALSRSPRQAGLAKKAEAGDTTQEELHEFWELQRELALEVLRRPLDDLYLLHEVCLPLPPRARVAESRTCDRCAEPTMVSRLVGAKGELVCLGCLERQETYGSEG